MLPELAPNDVGVVVDDVVTEIIAVAGVHRPPVDAFRIADSLDVAVVIDAHLEGRARYVRLPSRGRGAGRPTIVLRPDPRPERRHWAVAHEIGEHLAPRLFDELGVRPDTMPPASREVLANLLAARLLLPSPWFRDASIRHDYDLDALKALFTSASHELVARRWLDQTTDPVVVTVADHGQIKQRFANWDGPVPKATPDEAVCLAAANRTGQPVETMSPIGRLRAWPVHEPGWRREILRTEVQAFA